MTDKFRAVVLVLLLVCVVSTLGIYAFGGYPLETGELGMVSVAGVIVLGALFIVRKKLSAVKKGLPTRDEMERRVSHKAGYYAFIASIWFSLAVMFYAGIGVEEYSLPALLPRHYPALIVAFTGLVFVVSYLWLDWKGSVE